MLADENISSYKLGKKFGHTSITIQSIRRELYPDKSFSKLTKNANKWTKEEDLFLKENYLKLSQEELASKLNRTPSAIRNRLTAKKLYLRKKNKLKEVY